MLRNLPNELTRARLIQVLEEQGFRGSYNFLYVPIDFNTRAALGYAFISFESPSMVPRFWRTLDGFSEWNVSSRRACHVSWCEPDQGVEAHIERYRNSSVMHASVPDEFRPVLLRNGQRVPFPPPTRTVKAPRSRDCWRGSCRAGR
jgi:hypothetical protein